ncbi:MAG: sensor histidine kinase [bacterium]
MNKNFLKFIEPLRSAKKSLAFKLILWIGVILVISFKLFIYLENVSDKKMMLNQIKQDASRLSDIIKRSTYNDMLRARSNEVQEVFETIGAQEDVRKVRIIEQGRIIVSSDKQEMGTEVDQMAESCYDCHKVEGQKPLTISRYRFFVTEDGESVLGFVNPIKNENECQSCHGTEKKVLGMLDVILSTEKVYNTISSNQKRFFLFIICFFLLISISIGIFILRFVNRPIRQLTNGTRRITDGDLDHHIKSFTEDEIGELARSFNRMTDDLKTYQEHLIHAKEYIDNIIGSMIDTLIVVNPDGTIRTVNQAALRLLKYEKDEELIGLHIGKILAKDTPFFEWEDLYILLKKDSIRNYDTIYKAKDGTEIPINLSASVMKDKAGNLLAIVCVARDMREIQKLINDLKQAYQVLQSTQTQLIQSSRLASMGVLAAGIAHEINNPINSIINFAGLLQDEVMPDTEPADYVQWILKEGQRIINIVKNLLSFARSDKQEQSPCIITEIIDTSISFTKSFLAKDGIKIQSSFEPDLPRIRAKSSQLEQVFINLIINARDALNEKYPTLNENKIIKIEVKSVEKDGIPYIRILFRDNGNGIDEESLDKIFDPFFTTKTVGKGTGLGLSISYGIIADHKGSIEVSSKKGFQTSFTIDLPAEKKVVHAAVNAYKF